MQSSLGTPPADLALAGCGLWKRIENAVRDESAPVELDPWEVELVAEVCRAVDRCAALRERIAAAEAAGDDRLWLRMVQEERQQRAIMGRVVAAAGLPTGVIRDELDGGSGSTPRSRRGVKAAKARWGTA